MTQDIRHLSEQDLADLISHASKALEQKQQQTRRETIAQMKELAASIGAEIVISESASRKGPKVAVKYPRSGQSR